MDESLESKLLFIHIAIRHLLIVCSAVFFIVEMHKKVQPMEHIITNVLRSTALGNCRDALFLNFVKTDCPVSVTEPLFMKYIANIENTRDPCLVLISLLSLHFLQGKKAEVTSAERHRPRNISD